MFVYINVHSYNHGGNGVQCNYPDATGPADVLKLERKRAEEANLGNWGLAESEPNLYLLNVLELEVLGCGLVYNKGYFILR